MTKDNADDAIASLFKEQKEFPFPRDKEYSVEYVGETPEGYGLFRRKEGHGGYSYWTDEIPPALNVYDEGLSNIISEFAALNHLGVGETMWRHLQSVYGYTDK